MANPVFGNSNLGSVSQPEVNQQEQTAHVAHARQQQGLVKDTIEIPLTMIGGDHYKQYNSSETKPRMPMYIQVFLNRNEKEEATWLKTMKEVANKLPNELKAALKKQLKLPSDQRDPRFNALMKSLQFAGKGLEFLRAAKEMKLQIKEEERKKREEARVSSSLDFYRQLVKGTQEVTKLLDARCVQRPYLLHIVMKIPKILSQIGKKRGKGDGQTTDDAILKEIGELMKYVDKNLGEKRPVLVAFLIEYLQMLHQFSYQSLNHALFRKLYYQYPLMRSAYAITGETIEALSEHLLGLLPKSVFDRERVTLVMEMFGATLIFMERGEKKDFAFQLVTGMIVASNWLSKMGTQLFKGLLIEQDELLRDAFLAVLFGTVLLLSEGKKLKEKEKEELFYVLKKELWKRVQGVLKGIKKEGPLRVFLMKIKSSLEKEELDVLMDEGKRGLKQLGLSLDHLERDKITLEAFLQLIEGELAAFQKEEQQLRLTARSA